MYSQKSARINLGIKPLSYSVNRATKFLVIKNPLNKVVSVFLFDHFSELGFETIVDGAQRGTFREKLFSWFNAVMVYSV